jgi:predicted RNA binding protein YcfA (HicA-like mRNA interferase family)
VSAWPSTKAKQVLAALLRVGWAVRRQTSSHRVLSRPGWDDVVFAFHDGEEIGPRMLARIREDRPQARGSLKAPCNNNMQQTSHG